MGAEDRLRPEPELLPSLAPPGDSTSLAACACACAAPTSLPAPVRSCGSAGDAPPSPASEPASASMLLCEGECAGGSGGGTVRASEGSLLPPLVTSEAAATLPASACMLEDSRVCGMHGNKCACEVLLRLQAAAALRCVALHCISALWWGGRRAAAHEHCRNQRHRAFMDGFSAASRSSRQPGLAVTPSASRLAVLCTSVDALPAGLGGFSPPLPVPHHAESP